MSERYPFGGDKTLVSNSSAIEENVVWTEDSNQTSISLSYSDANDATLTDSINETYTTADEDNATQYLSVLETTNDITLECLHNLTLGQTKMEHIETAIQYESEADENLNTTTIEMGDQQVVVFSIDGSDDLYGIQLAQDEDGTIQKYQFKFRTNEDGQLEAIPESIQLLPNDDEDDVAQEETEVVEEQQVEEESINIFVQDNNMQEHVLSVENEELTENEEEIVITRVVEEEQEVQSQEEDDMEEEEQEDEETLEYDEPADSKAGLLDELKMRSANIKQEIQRDESSQNTEQFGNIYDNNDEEQVETEDSPEENVETIVEYQEDEYETEVNAQNLYVTAEDIKRESTTKQHHYEEIFVEETHIVHEEAPEEVLMDSEPEDYEIVEGLHITGDLENDENTLHEPETVLQEVVEKPAQEKLMMNILKQQPEKLLLKDANKQKNYNHKTLLYYVVPQPEKENVNSLQTATALIKTSKTNPRSILKSSYPVEAAGDVGLVENERLNKRFARNKEAMQARQFHNFISKTTIIQAPIRQERLPRKQTIKPVDERVDEEIIVQEVMVNSKGFVEDLKKNNSIHADYVEFIDLTDSDDDYSPKKRGKKKKKYKTKGGDSVATSDSDFSVVEINSDEDEDDWLLNPKKSVLVPKRGRGRPRKSLLKQVPIATPSPLKRRRGRPPKVRNDEESSEESPLKKSRTTSEEECVKKEVNCPHCPKSFPSENSLNTHIQHHNLENSLRNQTCTKSMNNTTKTVAKNASHVVTKYKHECANCAKTFINTILLSRHVCDKTFDCGVCKKKFTDVAKLSIHKRVHVKAQMVQNTVAAKVSPKKFAVPAIPSTSTKSAGTSRSTSNLFKCKDCSKVFYNSETLTKHCKFHQKLTCNSCRATFSSRLLLDTHLREHCVKQMSPTNKRLSFKVKKSFVQSPKRSSMRPSNVKKPTTTQLSIKCEFCPLKFSLFANLLRHKVRRHGLKTPDKNILTPKPKSISGFTPKTENCGIPASKRLNKFHADLKKALLESTDK